MIPGFNTAVQGAGTEYHVQTEDLGARTASILTLVYRGGAIVARQKTSYRERLGESPSPDEIRHLMEAQHQAHMRRAATGEFAAAGSPPPSGASPPTASTQTPVDRLIEEYLARRRARRSHG